MLCDCVVPSCYRTQHTTPQLNSTQHTTPHHTTPHHNTTHHTITQHNATQHTTPHHTTPHHTGSALQEFRSLGSDRLLGRTPRPPSWWARALQEFHRPPPSGSVAVHCRSCTAHRPQAVWQCIAGVPQPTAPKQCGSALQEYHSPLPPGSVAVHSRSCTAHCPQAERQCIAGVALPTAPRQWGNALQKFQCPLPTAHKCSVAGHTQCSAVHSTKQCGTAHKVQMVQNIDICQGHLVYTLSTKMRCQPPNEFSSKDRDTLCMGAGKTPVGWTPLSSKSA